MVGALRRGVFLSHNAWCLAAMLGLAPFGLPEHLPYYLVYCSREIVPYNKWQLALPHAAYFLWDTPLSLVVMDFYADIWQRAPILCSLLTAFMLLWGTNDGLYGLGFSSIRQF